MSMVTCGLGGYKKTMRNNCLGVALLLKPQFELSEYLKNVSKKLLK